MFKKLAEWYLSYFKEETKRGKQRTQQRQQRGQQKRGQQRTQKRRSQVQNILDNMKQADFFGLLQEGTQQQETRQKKVDTRISWKEYLQNVREYDNVRKVLY